MTSIARMYCAFIFPSPRATQSRRDQRDRPAFFIWRNPSLHILDALDKRLMLRAVFVPDRLYCCLEFFFVGDVVDLGAALLHLGKRLLLHVVPKGALLLLRLLGQFHDESLIVLG